MSARATRKCIAGLAVLLGVQLGARTTFGEGPVPVINVPHMNGGPPIYYLDPNTPIFRVQPPHLPMLPHESNYFVPYRYGLPAAQYQSFNGKPFWALYVSTDAADLNARLAKGNYFAPGDQMMPATTLPGLMREARRMGMTNVHVVTDGIMRVGQPNPTSFIVVGDPLQNRVTVQQQVIERQIERQTAMIESHRELFSRTSKAPPAATPSAIAPGKTGTALSTPAATPRVPNNYWGDGARRVLPGMVSPVVGAAGAAGQFAEDLADRRPRVGSHQNLWPALIAKHQAEVDALCGWGPAVTTVGTLAVVEAGLNSGPPWANVAAALVPRLRPPNPFRGFDHAATVGAMDPNDPRRGLPSNAFARDMLREVNAPQRSSAAQIVARLPPPYAPLVSMGTRTRSSTVSVAIHYWAGRNEPPQNPIVLAEWIPSEVDSSGSMECKFHCILQTVPNTLVKLTASDRSPPGPSRSPWFFSKWETSWPRLGRSCPCQGSDNRECSFQAAPDRQHDSCVAKFIVFEQDEPHP